MSSRTPTTPDHGARSWASHDGCCACRLNISVKHKGIAEPNHCIPKNRHSRQQQSATLAVLCRIVKRRARNSPALAERQQRHPPVVARLVACVVRLRAATSYSGIEALHVDCSRQHCLVSDTTCIVNSKLLSRGGCGLARAW